jgi:hypothetical protein
MTILEKVILKNEIEEILNENDGLIRSYKLSLNQLLKAIENENKRADKRIKDIPKRTPQR